MHKILPVLLLCISISASAQLKKNNISRILGTLAADSMAGRKAGSEQSDKAASFIASEFIKNASSIPYLEQRGICSRLE
jgi:hypothetical protein